MDRNERIAARAYAIWEEEGRPEGRSEEHWRRADREVDEADRGAAKVPRSAKRKAKAALVNVAEGVIAAAAAAASAGIEAAGEAIEQAIEPNRRRTRKARAHTTVGTTERAVPPVLGENGKRAGRKVSRSPADVQETAKSSKAGTKRRTAGAS